MGSRSSSKHAFTLVELSIVLVILGLLVGGVLTGQSLIRAAELRSITTQYNAYTTAVNAFKDKYFALPGDMTNATSFWGAAHATPATCITTVGTGTQTCNGDGNGKVALGIESFRFWQHLANAGLIAGNFDGVTHGSTTYSANTANSPGGKISSSLWFPWWMGANSGSTLWFDGDYGNAMQFGGLTTDNNPANPILKPEEAWNIDTKMDDGKPATGIVGIRTLSVLNICSDSAASNNTAANYNLANTSLACALEFRNVF